MWPQTTWLGSFFYLDSTEGQLSKFLLSKVKRTLSVYFPSWNMSELVPTFLGFNFHRLLNFKKQTISNQCFAWLFQRACKTDFTFIYTSWLSSCPARPSPAPPGPPPPAVTCSPGSRGR